MIQQYPLQVAIAVVVSVLIGWLIRFLVERLRTQSIKKQAQELRAEADREAERIKKESALAAKETLFKQREEFQKETSETRQELKQMEKRLGKREDNLDRKVDLLNKKERYVENQERTVAAKEAELGKKEKQLDEVIEEEKKSLHRISGLSHEDAKELLLKRLEKDVQEEAGELISRITDEAKETAEQQARNTIAAAIQRCAADHTAEMVVSSVDIPSDEMKGRIIGREGRNIRAFEKATGIDVVVDDTPGVIVVSGFDSVRREIARRSMEKLIQDGRIHPARIEQVVENTRKEVEEVLVETGKQVSLDTGVRGLHQKEIQLLGRLKFRTSYGQNVLQHSIEVCHLSGLLAAELNLNVQLAKRCGLLHDIGKALDHDTEGGHPEIGMDIAKRLGENATVLNAIVAHHEGNVAPDNIYTILVSAADAISASRPGARRETLERYIKRLERLEEVANAFPGVESAYAIQAGREIRVIVNSDRVSDKQAVTMCRDIAKEIEEELTYPGEVKVTLIRETRVVEHAR